MPWLGTPPWSVCFQASRRLRTASCCLRPPSGLATKAWAWWVSSSRIWLARQRCQPSSSPAAPRACWAAASSRSPMLAPCSFKAARTALAAPTLALPWPSDNSCSSLASRSRTICVACERISGSILGLTGFSGLADRGWASPRATRIASAHTGTAGSGAALSPRAATAWDIAASKAFHSDSSCDLAVSSWGANLASRLGHWASAAMALAWVCHRATSARSTSHAACASASGLVDSTSMRWAISSAASRCTCARCCRSSISLTRSDSLLLTLSKGSLDKGAPALAASRCHARASAILSLLWASSVLALSAHSAARCSDAPARLISSSFSRRGLAAPLSLALSSLNTSCICSALGLVASHSRTLAARSPEVGALKAPPVKASSGCTALLALAGLAEPGDLRLAVSVTVGSEDFFRKLSMRSIN